MLSSQWRGSFNTSTTNDIFYVLCYTPSMLRGFQIVSNGGTPVLVGTSGSTQFSNNPAIIYAGNLQAALTAGATDNGKSSNNIRPARMALRIRNITAAQNVAGEVQCFHSKTGLNMENVFVGDTTPASFTLNINQDFLTRVSLLMDTENIKTVTAQEVASKTHIAIARPSSSAGYHTWQDFQPGFTAAGPGRFPSNVSASNFNYAVAESNDALCKGADGDAMETIILKFPKTSTANTYTLQFMEQSIVRFSAGNLLGALASKPVKALGDRGWNSMLSAVAEGFVAEAAYAVGAAAAMAR